MVNLTWVGAGIASSKALLINMVRVASIQLMVMVLVRLTEARGVKVKLLESTVISAGTMIAMSPLTKVGFFVSKENS